MLEGDDEPKRASGETEPELRVAETQTDSFEEEIKEPEGEERAEKEEQEECEEGLENQGQEECEEGLDKQGQEECEEGLEKQGQGECEEKLEKQSQEECKEGLEKQGQEECETTQIQEKEKEAPDKEEHGDKSLRIEKETNIHVQETIKVKSKANEEQKDAAHEENELPLVECDKEDCIKEKQEDSNSCENINGNSEPSSENNLDRETLVSNKKEESSEDSIEQETSPNSQGNQDKGSHQENVGVVKQVVEEKEQELDSTMSSDLQMDVIGPDHTTEEVVQEIEAKDMPVESFKSDLEEPNLELQKMIHTSGKEETIPVDNSTIDKERLSTDQEMGDSFKEEDGVPHESVKKKDDVEVNDTKQNKNDPANTEAPEGEGTLSPSHNADLDTKEQQDVGKTCTTEKVGENLGTEDQDENYDELNDSDESLELKICIEGITEVGSNADDFNEEGTGNETQNEEGENRETEEMPLCEETMEVEEGGNDDMECDEVNGLGAIEDDEDLNDEEFIPEDTTSSSFPDGSSLPQCRLKRNYTCVHCGINTQNPREYLYHLRDDHGEKMKVFECSHCIYASKNHQKLIRHARMVHKVKIKKQEASPCKPQSKSSGFISTTSKSTRASVSPGKSSRSSPGKSPRSNDSAQDEWDEMEDEDDQELDQDGSPIKGDDKKLYSCEQCSYSCRSRKLLNKHETSYHLKRRFFRCVKCNYVTHLKGRYTKHLKYHQLPILKCDYCDFRTPYRWNLERHLKNHNEDCGEFKCHLCNFTAQIKQSLTVHISNHHLTSEQIREREKRRTIGISDPADFAFDDQEMELMRLERDEHPDALIPPGYDGPDSPTASEPAHGQHNGNNSFRVSNIDVSSQEDSHINADDGRDDDGEPKKKKPKIKITLKKMKVSKPKDTFFQELNERHNFEEDFIHPDDVVHRHGNVYIKNFKCRFCPFKAAFKNEIVRHEKKIHAIPLPKYMGQVKKARKTIKSSKLLRSSSSDDVITQILQFPQNENKHDSEETNTTESPQKCRETDEAMSDIRDEGSSKDKDEAEYEDLSEDKEDSVDAGAEQLSNSKESSPSKDCAKKKGLSFFEKLQEKMPTSNVQNLVCQFCGHESKCLSESVRHQKLHLSAKNIYASASLSTRCQFCRHRCKTTDDLMSHLKLCPEARKNQITDSGRRASGGRLDENEDSQCSSERGENADYDDIEEDSMNELGEKTPVLLDGTAIKKEDVRHPMENRVFVWNKFEKSEDQEKSLEGKEKVDRGSRRSSVDSNKRKRSSSKSPVDMEGSLDYYIESPTAQGHHYYNKRVYRCPQCSFWATTASRFHVHIVGHFNRKPYNCSECGYKSNWRWDITKHIKLKTSRDSSHQNAQVLITDETGEKNYEKYDCYVTIIQLDETNAHRTEGGIPNRKGRPKRTPEKEEILEAVTPSASPIRKPPMVAIPVMPRLQPMPRLTRAPSNSPATSRPGPMPFGPILPGAQLMVQLAGSQASSSSNPRPPPPLTLKGAMKSGTSTPTPSSSTTTKSSASGNTDSTDLSPGGQYQIITPQVKEITLFIRSSVWKDKELSIFCF